MEDTKRKVKSSSSRINRLAKPKKLHTPTTPKRDSKPLNQLLQRLEELTLPPSRLTKKSSKHSTKSKGKSSDISKKLKGSAKQKKVSSKLCTSGKDSNLDAHISERLERLALPIVRIGDYIHHKDPTVVSQRALKYKPSPRILELARPVRPKTRSQKKTNKCRYKFNKKRNKPTSDVLY